MTQDNENYAAKQGIACLGRVPFDSVFTKAMIQAQILFDYNGQSDAGREIIKIWQQLADKLECY
jgi:MinD superfamily P-loop ATPase